LKQYSTNGDIKALLAGFSAVDPLSPKATYKKCNLLYLKLISSTPE